MSLVFLIFLFWSNYHRSLPLPRRFSRWGIKSWKMLVTSSIVFCLPIALWQELGLYWTGCWCDFPTATPPQVSSLCLHFRFPRKNGLWLDLCFVTLRKTKQNKTLPIRLITWRYSFSWWPASEQSRSHCAFQTFISVWAVGLITLEKRFRFSLFLFFNFDVLGVFCGGLPNAVLLLSHLV